MLGRTMESWPTEALQRVADARAMCAGSWNADGDVGCLLVTAFVTREAAQEALGRDTMFEITSRFDRLHDGGRLSRDRNSQWRKLVDGSRGKWVRRIPVDTLRRMCADRARRILAKRVLAEMPQLQTVA